MDFLERQYISQYGSDVLGLEIRRQGERADADDGVTLTLVREADPDNPSPVSVLSRGAQNVDVGRYEISLTSEESSVVGNYTLVWTYAFDGVEEEYRTYAVIGQASPDYDRLDNTFKDLVDQVWVRFADLFDSPNGGPHLQTYFQAHWGRNRVAQMMRIALGKLNTKSQPNMTYGLYEGESLFPMSQWGAVLEQGTYIECVRHLIRSYVEQPAFVGSGAVSRLDRRDYMDRWRSVLQDEQADFQSQTETFKISHMMMGRPKVLVSGGVYGRYGPTRVAGSIAARPRYWTRFY